MEHASDSDLIPSSQNGEFTQESPTATTYVPYCVPTLQMESDHSMPIELSPSTQSQAIPCPEFPMEKHPFPVVPETTSESGNELRWSNGMSLMQGVFPIRVPETDVEMELGITGRQSLRKKRQLITRSDGSPVTSSSSSVAPRNKRFCYSSQEKTPLREATLQQLQSQPTPLSAQTCQAPSTASSSPLRFTAVVSVCVNDILAQSNNYTNVTPSCRAAFAQFSRSFVIQASSLNDLQVEMSACYESVIGSVYAEFQNQFQTASSSITLRSSDKASSTGYMADKENNTRSSSAPTEKPKETPESSEEFMGNGVASRRMTAMSVRSEVPPSTNGANGEGAMDNTDFSQGQFRRPGRVGYSSPFVAMKSSTVTISSEEPPATPNATSSNPPPVIVQDSLPNPQENGLRPTPILEQIASGVISSDPDKSSSSSPTKVQPIGSSTALPMQQVSSLLNDSALGPSQQAEKNSVVDSPTNTHRLMSSEFIYARWRRENYFYAVKVVSDSNPKNRRFIVLFEDGSRECKPRNSLLFFQWLPPGYEVSADVKGIQEFISNFLIEGHEVDANNAICAYRVKDLTTQNLHVVDRYRVSIHRTQAMPLLSAPIPEWLSLDTTVSSVEKMNLNTSVSMENIVFGKRNAKKKLPADMVLSKDISLASRRGQGMSSSSVTGKSDDGPESDAGVEKRKTPGRRTRHSARTTDKPSTSTTPSERRRGRPRKSIDTTSTSEATSPKKQPNYMPEALYLNTTSAVDEDDGDDETRLDPHHDVSHMSDTYSVAPDEDEEEEEEEDVEQEKQLKLFNSCLFMVTSGDAAAKENSAAHRRRSVYGSPLRRGQRGFNRTELQHLIEMNGGVVIKDMTEEHAKKCADGDVTIYLIAPDHTRTLKYLQCLAFGRISCLHYSWVYHCCDTHQLQPEENFLLPRGWCLPRQALVDWSECNMPLLGLFRQMRIIIVSPGAGQAATESGVTSVEPHVNSILRPTVDPRTAGQRSRFYDEWESILRLAEATVIPVDANPVDKEHLTAFAISLKRMRPTHILFDEAKVSMGMFQWIMCKEVISIFRGDYLRHSENILLAANHRHSTNQIFSSCAINIFLGAGREIRFLPPLRGADLTYSEQICHQPITWFPQ